MALDDSRFQDGPSACIQAMDARNLDSMVAEAIEHRNIAGLCDPAKKNWYPVNLDDVVRGANKLGIDFEQMRQIIATAEWAQSG